MYREDPFHKEPTDEQRKRLKLYRYVDESLYSELCDLRYDHDKRLRDPNLDVRDVEKDLEDGAVVEEDGAVVYVSADAKSPEAVQVANVLANLSVNFPTPLLGLVNEYIRVFPVAQRFLADGHTMLSKTNYYCNNEMDGTGFFGTSVGFQISYISLMMFENMISAGLLGFSNRVQIITTIAYLLDAHAFWPLYEYQLAVIERFLKLLPDEYINVGQDDIASIWPKILDYQDFNLFLPCLYGDVARTAQETNEMISLFVKKGFNFSKHVDINIRLLMSVSDPDILAMVLKTVVDQYANKTDWLKCFTKNITEHRFAVDGTRVRSRFEKNYHTTVSCDIVHDLFYCIINDIEFYQSGPSCRKSNWQTLYDRERPDSNKFMSRDIYVQCVNDYYSSCPTNSRKRPVRSWIYIDKICKTNSTAKSRHRYKPRSTSRKNVETMEHFDDRFTMLMHCIENYYDVCNQDSQGRTLSDIVKKYWPPSFRNECRERLLRLC